MFMFELLFILNYSFQTSAWNWCYMCEKSLGCISCLPGCFPYKIHNIQNALNILITIWGFQTSKANQRKNFEKVPLVLGTRQNCFLFSAVYSGRNIGLGLANVSKLGDILEEITFLYIISTRHCQFLSNESSSSYWSQADKEFNPANIAHITQFAGVK